MRTLSSIYSTRPWLALMVIALICLAFSSGAARLGFGDGLDSAFGGQTQEFRDFQDNRERFSTAEGDIIVSFRADQPLSGPQLQAIRDFTLEATFAPRIVSTVSLFALRTPPSEDVPSQPIFPRDLHGHGDARALLLTARDHPLGGNRLLSEDLTQTLVLVTLDPARVHVGSAQPTIEALDHLLDEVRAAMPSLAVEMTGLVLLRQVVIDGLLSDLVLLTGIGVAIGSIVCVVALRSVLLSLLSALPAAVALLWVLGCMGWLGLEINTFTNAIPVLILVLALCDSLHLTYEVRRCAPNHDDLADAVVEALEKIAPACALTSFTTAIAFAALLISNSDLIRSLGWAGVLASLVSLMAVLLSHPVGFLVVGRSRLLSGRLKALLLRPSPPLLAVLDAHVLWRFSVRRAPLVVVFALVGFIIALSLFSAARPQYSFSETIPANNPALQSLQQISAAVTPTAAIDIPIKLSGHWSDDLDRIKIVKDAVSSVLPGAPTLSLLDLAVWLGSEQAPAIDGFEPVLDLLSPAQTRRYMSLDYQWALLRVFIEDEGARETQSIATDLSEAFATTQLSGAQVGNPTGLLVLTSLSSLSIISHLSISFAVAVLMAGVFIAVWFRSPLFGLVALAPNLMPIALVGAWLFLSGDGLQYSSALALTIAFGIAVDDSVHVLNRLRFTAPKNRLFDRLSVEKVYSDVSPVLVATTTVLGFGMLGTQYSNIPTVAYFGILCIAVFVLALFAVMVVLPAMMTVLGSLAGPAKGH